MRGRCQGFEIEGGIGISFQEKLSPQRAQRTQGFRTSAFMVANRQFATIATELCWPDDESGTFAE